jgi:hypothetical protein
MLDLIGLVFGTAVYATMLVVLVGLSSASELQKWITALAAAVWGGLIVSIAARGGFGPGATGPVPAPGIAFVALIAVLFGGWFLLPKFRSALLSVPLPALIALNVARVGGVMFLILAAEGRLSAPFAPSAGWGDIVTGLFAIPLAAMARRDSARIATPLALWNAFGVLDLVAAVSLGMLSAPGTPFRVFTDEPGTTAMARLPWVMIPALLVPIFLLVHLTIATKLRSVRRLTAASATA